MIKNHHTDDNDNHNNREMIEHQIETVIKRSNSLAPDHPAQKGIERTLQKLYVEADAED